MNKLKWLGLIVTLLLALGTFTTVQAANLPQDLPPGFVQTTEGGGSTVTGYSPDLVAPGYAFSSSAGTYTAIINGITFAADNGAKVINMSLGGATGSTALQDAVIYAYNKGVTVVCAAGNAGTSAPQYPAAYPQCISVSAVRYNQTYTSYTSYGSTIDICAPGGDVTVDQNGDGYVDGVLQQTHDGTNYSTFGYYFYEGTSMACPHVAGVAALLIAKAGGTMPPDAVRAALQNTATDLGTVGWDQYYGYGLVNANAALSSIGSNPPVAAFSGTPLTGTAPLTVAFTDASTYNPTTWSWNFGDGGTSTLQNPSHVYSTAGTYSVTLTVANAYGSNTLTKTGYVTVSAPPTNPPVANFTGTPTSGTVPLTVVFTDASTNTPTSWSWNFGDGGTSTLQNPSHVYSTAGTYTVSLTVSNAYGSNTLTRTNYITASAVTLQCDDFNDGNYAGWVNATGTWSISISALRGNSTTLNAKITSPFGSYTTGTITCAVGVAGAGCCVGGTTVGVCRAISVRRAVTVCAESVPIISGLMVGAACMPGMQAASASRTNKDADKITIIFLLILSYSFVLIHP